MTILSGPCDPVPIFYPLKPMPKIILNLDSDQQNKNKISSQMSPSTINLGGLSFYCSDGFNVANLQNFGLKNTSNSSTEVIEAFLSHGHFCTLAPDLFPCHPTSEEKDLLLISDQPDFVLSGNSLKFEQAIYKDVNHDKPTTMITVPDFSQTSQFLILDADTRKATKIIV